jgi:hypothetical protein
MSPSQNRHTVRRLIDDYMPEYDVRERHKTIVDATPEDVYASAMRLDLGHSPVIGLLRRLRALPVAMIRGESPRPRLSVTLDDLQESGFVLLAENPGRELVLGLTGRFWTLSGGVRQVPASEFASFNLPGYSLAALNFTVGRMASETVLRTETRVRCTDPASRRKFRAYWTVIGPFSGLIRMEMLRLIKADAESSLTIPAS